jgi:hypothetical protein
VKRATLFFILVTAALLAPGAQAAPTWLAPTTLTPADKDMGRADLAVSPQGDVIVWWSGPGGVEFSLRPAGGDFARVLENTQDGSPDVAFDSAGNAVAVWSETSGGAQQTFASFRPAGGTFATGVPISKAMSGQFAGLPHVAVGANGDAVAVWEFFDGAENRIQAAIRPAGGTFGDAQTISAAGHSAGNVDVAVDAEGNAIAVWPRSNGTNDLIEAASRPAGGSFGMGVPISDAGQNAGGPHAAFDQSGNALAVWSRSDGTKRRAQASFRPKGGSFQPANTLSDMGEDAELVQVVFDPQGNALVYWMRHFWIETAFRPAGGPFEAAKRISPIDHNGWYPNAAFTPNGDAHMIWADQDTTSIKVVEAVRPPGGSFGDFHPISADGAYVYEHYIATDAEGNAAASWLLFDNGKKRVQVAGFDGAPPRLSNVSFPASGLAGNPLSFGATASDVWGPIALAWDFGDGSTGDGGAPTHAYAGPGTFSARVTATDAVGNASSASGNVAVVGLPTIATRDLLAPVMSALKLSPTRFAAAPKRSSRAAKTGTTITYKLSEAARVTFRVQRAAPGRRVGRGCRKPTAKNRKRARCTRFVTLRGSFGQAAKAGANKRAFDGKLRGRPLARGSYRLVATAVDAAGNKGKQARASFRVLRAKR